MGQCQGKHKFNSCVLDTSCPLTSNGPSSLHYSTDSLSDSEVSPQPLQGSDSHPFDGKNTKQRIIDCSATLETYERSQLSVANLQRNKTKSFFPPSPISALISKNRRLKNAKRDYCDEKIARLESNLHCITINTECLSVGDSSSSTDNTSISSMTNDSDLTISFGTGGEVIDDGVVVLPLSENVLEKMTSFTHQRPLTLSRRHSSVSTSNKLLVGHEYGFNRLEQINTMPTKEETTTNISKGFSDSLRWNKATVVPIDNTLLAAKRRRRMMRSHSYGGHSSSSISSGAPPSIPENNTSVPDIDWDERRRKMFFEGSTKIDECLSRQIKIRRGYLKKKSNRRSPSSYLHSVNAAVNADVIHDFELLQKKIRAMSKTYQNDRQNVEDVSTTPHSYQ